MSENEELKMKHKIPGFFIGLWAFLFPLISLSSLNAQEKIDLNRSVFRALEKNNLIRISDLSVSIAQKKVQESKSQYWPSLQLSSTYTRVGRIPSFTIPMGKKEQTFQLGTHNRINAGVELKLPLFTWGRIKGSVELSESGKKLSQIEKKQKIIEIKKNVLRSFYSAVLSKEMMELEKESVSRARRLFTISKKRFEAGNIPRLELLRTKVQLKNAQSQHEEAQKNLHQSKILLGKTIEMEPKDFIIEGTLHFEPLSVDSSQLIEKAYKNRKDIQILEVQKRMKENQIHIAKSGNKPNVFLFSSYSVATGFDPLNPDKLVGNWNAGIQVAAPFFDGFASKYRVTQNQLQLKKSQLQKKEMKEVIRMEVRQAVVELKKAEDKIHSLQENIKLARETLRVAMDQYEKGVASSLDVLNAQKTLNQTERLVKKALFSHIKAKLDLCQAIEDYSWFDLEY